jgi:hypothetical protein
VAVQVEVLPLLHLHIHHQVAAEPVATQGTVALLLHLLLEVVEPAVVAAVVAVTQQDQTRPQVAEAE